MSSPLRRRDAEKILHRMGIDDCRGLAAAPDRSSQVLVSRFSLRLRVSAVKAVLIEHVAPKAHDLSNNGGRLCYPDVRCCFPWARGPCRCLPRRAKWKSEYAAPSTISPRPNNTDSTISNRRRPLSPP